MTADRELIERFDLDELHANLIRTAGARRSADLRCAATARPAFGCPRATQSALLVVTPGVPVFSAVAEAARWARPSECASLTSWVRLTARQVLAFRFDSTPHVAGPARPGRAGEPLCVIDPDLDGRLPLGPLTRDAASLQPGRRLDVALSAELDVAGSYRRLADHAVIELDRSLLANTKNLDYVFAHELAHALDPGLVAWCIGYGAWEPFADTLGPILLAERPTSVSGAQPLIDAAKRATTQVTEPALSLWESIFVWLGDEFSTTARLAPSPFRGEGLPAAGIRSEKPALAVKPASVLCVARKPAVAVVERLSTPVP